jgi:hypothetical protein
MSSSRTAASLCAAPQRPHQLFTVARKNARWEIAAVDFLGENVTLTLTDRRDGKQKAALALCQV